MMTVTDRLPRHEEPSPQPPAELQPRRVGARMRHAGEALESGAARWFGRIVDLIVRLLVPLAIVALMMGMARVVLDLVAIYRSSSIAAGFDLLVTDILSMFIVIELLKSIVDYVEVHRLELTSILDAAVVFVLREVMIGLYKHAQPAGELAALALLLFVLGAFRLSAAHLSHRREDEGAARRAHRIPAVPR